MKKNVVLKFGGSVISDADLALGRVASIVRQIHFSYEYNVVAVVVSAIGKTTSNLDETMKKCATKSYWWNSRALLREKDAFLATGEMQTAPLLAAKLTSVGVVRAKSFNAWQAQIYTDNNFGNAHITHIGDAIPNAASYRIIPVVAGFQGITKNGDLTTLGREGSDITAMEIALKLKADFCWFFKDGGGIYDKNPYVYNDAKLLNFVPYQRMLNFIDTRPGQVLHRECVKRAKQKQMPIFVSGTQDLEKGTWVASKGFGYNKFGRAR